MIARRRRAVDLPNYRDDEGICSCGCGKASGDEIMMACQALCRILSRRYNGAGIQHRITGGARCKRKNEATIGSAQYSYHLIGAALDGTFWWRDIPSGPAWAMIPCDEVAKVAVASGLFGGVGHRKYKEAFVHLDTRPGIVVEW